MKFQFTPQRSDSTLAISVSGETVIINGIAYDLSPLTEGQSISFGVGSAKRDNGITVSLPLPYPQNPSIDPMQVYEVKATSGPVPVPGHDAEQPTEIVTGVIDWPAPVEPSIPQYERALDNMLDTEAQSRRYTNRLTCALRAGYPGPYQAEGIAFAQWMDGCNQQAYNLMLEVMQGKAPMPTIDEFLAMFPKMKWPD